MMNRYVGILFGIMSQRVLGQYDPVQCFGDVSTVQTDGSEHRFVLFEELRMCRSQASHGGEIAACGGGEEPFAIGELGPHCAVAHQEFDHLLAAGEHGVLDDQFARIKVDPAGIRAVLQQPARALDVVGHGVAEKLGEGARTPLAA